MKKALIALAFAVLVLAGIFFMADKRAMADIFAMDTVINVNISGHGAKNALSKVRAEISRLDNELNVNGTGELAKVNGGKAPNEEISALIKRCNEESERTGGCFDITVYPVLKLWGFTTGSYHVPSEQELAEAKLCTGYKSLDANSALPKGFMIDFGGAAKGYGADRLHDILKEEKINSALISLGGTVLAMGKKPYRVAIKAPDADGYAGSVEVSDSVVSTSGGYERFFKENGKTYIHIIDPKTGLPADNGLISATIVSRSGIESDILSTATYIMGEKKTKELWQKSDFEGVFVTDDKRIIVTGGLYEGFMAGDAEYRLEIWERE